MNRKYDWNWTDGDEHNYVAKLGTWHGNEWTQSKARTMRLLNNYINRGGKASSFARERLMILEKGES